MLTTSCIPCRRIIEVIQCKTCSASTSQSTVLKDGLLEVLVPRRCESMTVARSSGDVQVANSNAATSLPLTAPLQPPGGVCTCERPKYEMEGQLVVQPADQPDVFVLDCQKYGRVIALAPPSADVNVSGSPGASAEQQHRQGSDAANGTWLDAKLDVSAQVRVGMPVTQGCNHDWQSKIGGMNPLS